MRTRWSWWAAAVMMAVLWGGVAFEASRVRVRIPPTVEWVGIATNPAGGPEAVFHLHHRGGPAVEVYGGRTESLPVWGGFPGGVVTSTVYLSPRDSPRTVRVSVPRTENLWRVVFSYRTSTLRERVGRWIGRRVPWVLRVLPSWNGETAVLQSDWLPPTVVAEGFAFPAPVGSPWLPAPIAGEAEAWGRGEGR